MTERLKADVMPMAYVDGLGWSGWIWIRNRDISCWSLTKERDPSQVPDRAMSNAIWRPLVAMVALCVYINIFGNRLCFEIRQWQRWGDKGSPGGIICLSGMILMVLPAFPALIQDILIRNPGNRKRHQRAYRVGLMILWLGVLIAIVGFLMAVCSR